ncbi:hypothetical protein [Delftia tsuruhatensis]|nr:hypothetical protein [Delftia tsuruhatensis]
MPILQPHSARKTMSDTPHLSNSPPLKEQFKALLITKMDLTGIQWSDMETAIGENAEKYRPLWERMVNGKKGFFAGLSPCWTAIPFMGVSWAIARRVYAYAVVAFVTLVIINLLMPGTAGAGRVLGIAVAISFTVKRTYLQWLVTRIQQINQMGLTGGAREDALRQIGGLDQKNGWIAFGVLLAIGLVLAIF